MTEPEEIFVQPMCVACNENVDTSTGPMWCEDDVWSGACENCGAPVEATRYTKSNRAEVKTETHGD